MPMQPTSTMVELLPLAGLNRGHARPYYPSHQATQQLFPALKAGKLRSVFLTGAPGGGKTSLVTELARMLEPEGFLLLALTATPYQPLSTGRILAAFESAFLQHKLTNEWEILSNPLISIEDRLGVVAAVMNRRTAFVLILDGLESCLDPETGHFMEPAMGAFFAYILDQLQGLSRVLITSRKTPIVNAPAPLPATCYQEISPPEKTLFKNTSPHSSAPAPIHALRTLDDATLTRIIPMATFHYPVPLDAFYAVTKEKQEQITRLLDLLEKNGLAGHFTPPGMATLWYLHPMLRATANKIANNHPKDRKIHHIEAGKYLSQVEKEWGGGFQKDKNNDHIHKNKLQINGLDLSLEIVGHFMDAGAFDEALQHAKPVCDFFSQRGFYWEQEKLNRKLLAIKEHPRPLYLTAQVLLKGNHQEEARRLLERILTFDEDLFPKETALALFDLATLAMRQNPDETRRRLQKALAINQKVGDRSGQAVCQAHLGFLGLQQDDTQAALDHLETALELCRELEDQTGIANLLPWTGELLWRAGNIVQARSHFQEALTLLHAIGSTETEARLYHRLAVIDLGEEQFDKALTGFLRSLEIRKATEDQRGEASTFFQLGRLAKAIGNQEASLRFLGLCQRIDQEIGDPDAEQTLILFHEIATTTVGLDKAAAQTILDEVWIAYNKDRGDALITETFQAES